VILGRLWVSKKTKFHAKDFAMRRDYDIVEELPNGSRIWRACVTGRFEAQRKLLDLAEHSENAFLMIDANDGEQCLPPLGHNPIEHAAKKAAAG
jgi:hypothetical protein